MIGSRKFFTVIVLVVLVACAALAAVPAAYAAPGDATYSLTIHGDPDTALDFGLRIVAGGSGNVTYAGQAGMGLYAGSLDPAGTPLWGVPWFGTSVMTSLTGLAAGPTGNVYASGTAYSVHGRSGLLVVGWQAGGSTLGDRIWRGPRHDGSAEAVVTGADGSVYAVGESTGAVGRSNIIVVKYDAGLARQWVRSFDNRWMGNDSAAAIATIGGSVYVAGYAHHPRHGVHLVLVRYTTDGALKWVRYLDDDRVGLSWATGVAATGGAAYLIGSGAAPSPRPGGAAELVKYKTDGRYQWTRRVGPVRSSENRWWDVAIGPGGTVDVTGNVARQDTGIDAAAASFTQWGVRRWLRFETSAGDHTDTGQGIAVASDGSVYVGGFEYGPAGDDDVLGVAYAEDGTPMWRTLWDSGFGIDVGHDVAVNATRVWVVGEAATAAFGGDIVVVGFER
jgi:hypothetical protein